MVGFEGTTHSSPPYLEAESPKSVQSDFIVSYGVISVNIIGSFGTSILCSKRETMP